MESFPQPLTDPLQARTNRTLDGCSGGSLAGADFFRDVTQIVTSVTTSNRTIASFTIRRPAFGFPEITGSAMMLRLGRALTGKIPISKIKTEMPWKLGYQGHGVRAD